MAILWHLLRDGLRLALLLRPRHTPLAAGFSHWLVLALLGAALDVGWQWFAVEAPRSVNGYGVQTALASALLRLASCALVCALTGRRALFWCVAGWLEAALLPITVLAGASYLADQYSQWWLHWIGWCLTVAWLFAVLLRLTVWLRPRHGASLAAAVLGLGLLVAPWLWLDAQWLWQTDWSESEAYDDSAEYREPGELDAPESTIYAQPELLATALARLAPQRPERIDLYALAFGGDASEDVFRNEVEYAERLFAQRFDAADRSLGLLNHPETAATRPLATATNLERALQGLGERMDVEQDILLLYLTSHGSDEHELYVNQPPLPLDQVTPERLRDALDASGIRWRVVVVSACYSGGYIEALRDPQTLVITAASANRTSFGCGSASKITWFGKAFLAESLNQSDDFVAAFERAKKSIEAWEAKDDIRASKPQIERGEQVEAHLARWREEFEPGPALPFEVAGADQKSRRR